MKEIELPNTHRCTSQLGFGCSSLMGAIGRAESLALLEAAFNAGIRHFDVAPMYGYGAAENCLGTFLENHRDDVTVTTKYGIRPPANQGFFRAARRVLGPVLKLVPGAKKKLASTANSVVAAAPKAPFTVQAAQASLENSLRQLGRETLDILLLHEVEACDLERSDDLLAWLQDLTGKGVIGGFGCGSSADKIPSLRAMRPGFCSILQFDWSVLNSLLDEGNAFTLHHRALTEHFDALQAALRSDAERRRRWSAEIDADLERPGVLAALMLKAALVTFPESILLVSSRNPKHIKDNVRVAEDATLASPARKLYALVQQEGATLWDTSEPR